MVGPFMSVRPFDWRDIPALHRFRHQSTYLNSALVLTRGPMLMPGALLSYLAPGMGIFTSVGCCENGAKHTLIGQAIQVNGGQCAHLTFFTPSWSLDTPALSDVLDHLALTAGEHGAFRLLADVDEHTYAFEALRRSSFAIYSRQRIWQLTAEPAGEETDCSWSVATAKDVIPIRSLYNNVVPGLVQQVEPFSTQIPRGMLFRQDGELLAYVELRYGNRGIWAHPIVHPDVTDVTGWFVQLFQSLPFRRSRPVYICMRSYQSWLEPAIEDLGAEAGPRQAVMVKHLVIPQKAVRVFTLPALEGGHPEVSAPIARTESK
jgi:hypothetical protein